MACRERAQKTSSSWTRKSSPLRSSTTTRTMRGEGKRSEGAGRPSPFLHHGLVGDVTSSFLKERGETDVRVYQQDVLQGVVKHLNITLFSGQEWVFHPGLSSCPKGNDKSRVVAEDLLAFIRAENWLLGSAHLKPLDNKLWAVFEDMAC